MIAGRNGVEWLVRRPTLSAMEGAWVEGDGLRQIRAATETMGQPTARDQKRSAGTSDRGDGSKGHAHLSFVETPRGTEEGELTTEEFFF